MGAYDCDCINNLEYEKRERKAQLSKEGTTKGTTSDLISRTETVEHLRRVLGATVPITDYDDGVFVGVDFGVSTVSTMPTIQSQSTAGQLNDGAQTTDLIDRQQALDIFDDYNVSVEYGELEAYSRDRKRLCELPTVQPEPPIIKCKDCKWWKKQKDSAQGRCRLLGIYPTGGWYCANAERRTDK